ncbi:hypothetical protein V496_07568 [Pseudogymnoascus sp. VKM F-4515 (FW-2607)]|nr:hypothetical protein V496_07568 [Pseudogymnoascus sp. VKM F-4515 (FW-2607)]
MRLPSALTALALIAGSYAQSLYVQNELSFGHNGKMSPDLRTIPKFTLAGDATQIYSNKIILTPPAPGNKRAALWSQGTLKSPKWEASLQFRATGPERASGRIHLWLVQDGFNNVGTNSIYTVGKFEGLAIVIDQYGNSGGMIRAFLNDGSKHYGQHLSVDGLAFGHAPYPYRNLGRPSTVKVIQDWHNFRVEIDGALAFQTSAVRIPSGYNIGVSAASADSPDSFEVFSLTVTTAEAEEGTEYNKNPRSNNADPPSANKNAAAANAETKDTPPEPQGRGTRDTGSSGRTATGYLSDDRIPEAGDISPLPANAISKSHEFADLHYRIQDLASHLLALQADFQSYQAEATRRHGGLLERAAKAEAAIARGAAGGGGAKQGGGEDVLALLEKMDRRMQGMEQMLGETKRDVGGGSDRIERLRQQLLEGHTSILEGVQGTVGTLTGSMPKLRWVVLVVLGSQMGVVGAFWWYKRRKNVGFKKFL